MTDFSKVANVYYTCSNYNSGITNINSQQDTQLLYDLLKAGDSQNYSLAIAKMRTNLSGIPMTVSNIPLKTYELILRNTLPNKTVLESSAYVRQINALSGNFVYSLDGTNLNRYSYSSSSAPVLNRTVDLSSVCQYIYSYVLDDFQNVYIAGSNSNPNNADTVFICDSANPPNILDTTTYDFITSIYLDSNQKFYVADDGIGSGTVFVYFNQNGENTVNLTLQGTIRTDFADADITNINFVVATDNNIIVGHDTNIITFYNNQLNAIAQYTDENAHQYTAANVINSSNVLMVADSNVLADSLYGTANSFIYDVELNRQLSNTTTSASSIAVDNQGNGYFINPTNSLYQMPIPTANPPVSPTLENNTSVMNSPIASNKNGLYGITNTQQLCVWELSGATDALWDTVFGGFTNGPNDIYDMDYNIADNTLYIVDSTGAMAWSQYPVLPMNFMYYGAQVITKGSSNNNVNPSTADIAEHTVRSVNVNSNGLSQVGQYIYSIEGAIGSQVIQRRLFENYGLVNDSTTYTLAECNGVIRQMIIFNNYLIVYDGTNTLRSYTLGTTTEIANSGLTFADTALFSMCVLVYSGTYFMVSADTFASAYDATTMAAVGSAFECTYPITACTANSNDLNQGTDATFHTQLTGSSAQQLIKIVWSAGYTNGVSSLITNLSGNNKYSALGCNPFYGHVYGFVFNSNITDHIDVYVQYEGYNKTYNIQQDPNLVYSGVYVPNQATNPVAFQAISSNTSYNSISVSRSNPNTIYGVDLATFKINKGTISLGDFTIVSNVIPQFENTQYDFIGNAINTNTEGTTTLKCFTISNQQLLATTTINNELIKTIARNEADRLFVVPLKTTNQIASYNVSAVQQYVNALTDPIQIFVKNAEDIDAGAYSIYDLSFVIAAINNAFLRAYNSIIAQGGNLTEAPTMVLNANGTLTLDYGTDYATAGNGILFNNPLQQLCTFPSSPDTIDAGYFLLTLAPNSTSETQLTKSIYIFNQLNTIQIASQSLFINGSFFGANSFSQVIMDVDVPIDQFTTGNTGQILYFQPNFLRVFQLTSGGNPVNRIQITLYYSYRNGYVGIVPLIPGEQFSTTIQFIKKF